MTAAFGKHLMQRAAHQPTLQRRVRPGMTQRHARKSTSLTLKATNGPPQGRKRAHARTQHATLLTFRSVIHELVTVSFVHDMF